MVDMWEQVSVCVCGGGGGGRVTILCMNLKRMKIIIPCHQIYVLHVHVLHAYGMHAGLLWKTVFSGTINYGASLSDICKFPMMA